jgi:transcriptional regulator
MTNQDSKTKLTEQQEQAIWLILLGRKDEEVGKAVGVARQTISKWKNQNADFKAFLNKQRVENWENHRDKIRYCIGEAIQVIEENLANIEDHKIAQDAAIFVLKGTGCLFSDSAFEAYRPTGPITSKGVLQEEKERAEVMAIFDRTGS